MNERKLLLVVDMQNDFIDGSLGTPEAQAIVPKVCEKIRNWDGEIRFTEDIHHTNYLRTQEGRNLPVEHCMCGTDGAKISGEIAKAYNSRNPDDEFPPSPVIYMKNAFGSRQMIEDMKKEEAYGDFFTSVELVGLCTDICVISNAVLIKSFFPEIEISVDASCCAGVTPQSHKNALEAMKMLQIEIKNEEA